MNNHSSEGVTMETTQTMKDLSDLFKVLGDNTRLRILEVLTIGELAVGDIANQLEMTTSAISHQLRLLKSSKLVKNRRDGKSILYSLDDQHVLEILNIGLAHVKE